MSGNCVQFRLNIYLGQNYERDICALSKSIRVFRFSARSCGGVFYRRLPHGYASAAGSRRSGRAGDEPALRRHCWHYADRFIRELRRFRDRPVRRRFQRPRTDESRAKFHQHDNGDGYDIHANEHEYADLISLRPLLCRTSARPNRQYP